MNEFLIQGNMDAFILGIKAEQFTTQKKETDITKYLQKVSENLDTDFRQVFDSIIPNIHVVHTDLLINELIFDLLNNPEEYLYQESSTVQIPYSGKFSKGSINTSIITTALLQKIKDNIVRDIKAFHTRVKYTKGDPIKQLSDAMLESLTAIDNFTGPSQFLNRDIEIKKVFDLGKRFREQVNTIFKSKSILGIESAQFSDLDKSVSFVFFGKSFSSMVGAINDIVNKSFTKTLVDANMQYDISKASVGLLTHFGHSAVRHRATTILNTPGTAKLIFNKYNDNSVIKRTNIAKNAISKFKDETGHIEYQLKINKDMTNSMGTLARMGLTVTQTQLAGINLGMSPRERALSAQGYTTSSLAKISLRDKIKERDALRILINLVSNGNTQQLPNGRASPTIAEQIASRLANIIGKTTVNIAIKTQKVLSKTIDTKYKVRKADKSIVPPISLRSTTKASPKTLPSLSTKTQEYSLASLQTLINTHLQDVISANMGGGSDPRILNYRSGRFAASAKVENISQSRAGMITAFYSYMKNPYQTFEPGYAQGSPKTRDPKLLIATSIREIAATKVGNRLRAVSI